MPTTLTKPNDKCPVYVEQTVIEQIKKYGDGNQQYEICGVLLGNLCLTPDNEWIVVVDRIVPGKYAQHSQGSVTFTEETWKYVDEKMDKYYPHKTIVGWFHTHPGFGIFFSSDDLLVHRMGFRNEWQVAYVYDPVRNEDGWFLWDKDKKEPCLSNDVKIIDFPQARTGKNVNKTTDDTAIYQISEDSRDDTFKTRKTTARAFTSQSDFQSEELWTVHNKSFSPGEFLRSETMKNLIFSCVAFLLFMLIFVFTFAGYFLYDKLSKSSEATSERIEELENWKNVANTNVHNQELEAQATTKELDDKLATKTDKTEFEALKAKVDQLPDIKPIQEEQTRLQGELTGKATNEYVDTKTSVIDDKLTQFEAGVEERFAKIENTPYVKKSLERDQKNNQSKNKDDVKAEESAGEKSDENSVEDGNQAEGL